MVHPCKYPGCSRLLPKSGYCTAHKATAPDYRKDYERKRKADPVLSLAAKIRSSPQWQRVRRYKLGINPICEDPHGEHAGRNETVTAKQVHHIQGLATHPELAYVLTNLQSVCTRCHARLEAMERSGQGDQQRAERPSQAQWPSFG